MKPQFGSSASRPKSFSSDAHGKGARTWLIQKPPWPEEGGHTFPALDLTVLCSSRYETPPPSPAGLARACANHFLLSHLNVISLERWTQPSNGYLPIVQFMKREREMIWYKQSKKLKEFKSIYLGNTDIETLENCVSIGRL